MLHGIVVDWVWRVSEFAIKRKVKKNANANANAIEDLQKVL